MTTQVDFYSTAATTPGAAATLLCKVIDKAYRQGCAIYVHTDTPRQQRAFDELLWTFRDTSFVPHQRLGATAEQDVPPVAGAPTPVRIGCGLDDLQRRGAATLLCNLGREAPADSAAFERIIDASDGIEPGRSDARRRYAWYKQQGFALSHHSL